MCVCFCLLEYCCSAEKLLTVIFLSLSGSHFSYFLSPATFTDKREETTRASVVRVGNCLGDFFFIFFFIGMDVGGSGGLW